MIRSVLGVTAALLIVACEEATSPENTATLPAHYSVAANAVSSFSTDAVLSGNLATNENPITYTGGLRQKVQLDLSRQLLLHVWKRPSGSR